MRARGAPSYSECPNCAPLAPSPPVSAPPAEGAPPPLPPGVPDPAAEPPAAVAPFVAPPPSAPPPAAVSSLVVPVPASPPAPASRRVSVPGWLLSVMFALVFIVIGLTLIVVKQARQSAPAPPPSRAAQIESAEAVPTTQSNPEFRDLELVGFRLTEDDKQKAFAQFVVVNHSGADLGEIDAKAVLKAITARGQDPVGTFEFKVSLNAYESKEVKAALDTKLRVYELPDWQFLRAEITGH